MNWQRLHLRSGLVVGMMSGTSGDGVDVALVRFTEDGHSPDNGCGGNNGRQVIFPQMELISSLYVPYSNAQRRQVFELFKPTVSARYVAEMDVEIGKWFGAAAAKLLAEAGVKFEDIVAIGSHGQTVYHAPDRGITVQIGNPAVIAAVTGCSVVSDFRRADVAVGGQGAPLVPYFDYAYFSSRDKTRVVLNIGGISNITVLPQGAGIGQVAAFDTGPGNMLLDALAQTLSDGELAFDCDGQLAAQGTPAAEVIDGWIARDKYVHRTGPKSTGREQYGTEFLSNYQRDMTGMGAADQMATLTQFVARTVAIGIHQAVKDRFELIVSGGGRQNQMLMKWIQEFAQPERLVRPEEQGIPSDMKEAMAFALFAWQFVKGRATNVPSATGAGYPVVLGQWTPSPAAQEGYIWNSTSV
ncbi:anhydro-N-acetylmuramic acid kinase [Alicyclobacillus sp. SO9]|uniref:anhydro-N-acetylmuramic acid kinase n=1 Tax=Alicyclobacillus sp. SO9 TaxID=2665646 RepID=UPI0018E71AB3|nr:anhydro-N-acetylmuramic acid kinase [Alicyclobacillus sp. SO9]QQE79181.1 anhydro-N-acetylmuramic acid kinase [Alicyclobacillus sp. SO9]